MCCWIFDEVTKITYPGFASQDEADAHIARWGWENVTVHCRQDKR